jgi:hypothetical protein
VAQGLLVSREEHFPALKVDQLFFSKLELIFIERSICQKSMRYLGGKIFCDIN